MLKILQLSDLHLLPDANDRLVGVQTERCFQEVLNHAHDRHGPFDLILITGDLTQDPCLASYRRAAKILQPYRTPTLCVPGNHDDVAMMSAVLNDAPLACCGDVSLPHWRIIGLNSQKADSAVGHLAANELTRLERTLQDNPEQWAMIAVHHPSIACGSSWLDTMQIDNRDAFLTLLRRFPQVKAVASGHLHQALATSVHGIDHFVAPSTCFQFQTHSTAFSIEPTPPGYRIYRLFDDGAIEADLHRLDRLPEGLSLQSRRY